MNDTIINDLYDRFAKLLKNDQKYSYDKIATLLSTYVTTIENINTYYEQYPPLVDIVELGAGLEYASAEYKAETVQQINYKMLELKSLLPDIS